MTIRLQRHKTDHTGVGATIVIGRTGDELCPVGAVLAFMAIRPDISGPLFVRADGSPLSQEFLVQSVRTALAGTGLDIAGYNGHSFQIGAASTAAQAGLPDSFIQSLGCWKSAAFLNYIQVPTVRLKCTSSILSGQEKP